MPARKRGTRRRKRGAQSSGGIFAMVQAAREAAAEALRTLRGEIRKTQARLEKLIESERSFRIDLFGGGGERGKARRRGAARQPRRKGPPLADRFFKRLPRRFGIEDVRKLAGRLSGVSVAQWTRAKKVNKVGKGYQKTG